MSMPRFERALHAASGDAEAAELLYRAWKAKIESVTETTPGRLAVGKYERSGGKQLAIKSKKALRMIKAAGDLDKKMTMAQVRELISMEGQEFEKAKSNRDARLGIAYYKKHGNAPDVHTLAWLRILDKKRRAGRKRNSSKKAA